MALPLCPKGEPSFQTLFFVSLKRIVRLGAQAPSTPGIAGSLPRTSRTLDVAFNSARRVLFVKPQVHTISAAVTVVRSTRAIPLVIAP